jgi:hypothetical protein
MKIETGKIRIYWGDTEGLAISSSDVSSPCGVHFDFIPNAAD